VPCVPRQCQFVPSRCVAVYFVQLAEKKAKRPKLDASSTTLEMTDETIQAVQEFLLPQGFAGYVGIFRSASCQGRRSCLRRPNHFSTGINGVFR
jgi:hypothetical protein